MKTMKLIFLLLSMGQFDCMPGTRKDSCYIVNPALCCTRSHSVFIIVQFVEERGKLLVILGYVNRI